jgi:CTP:molybdopterin cytidylyltransferase MocA
MSDTSVVAIVLAAGASTRMGSPKSTLQWKGRAFVDHCVVLARECATTIVVDGATPLTTHQFARSVLLQHNPQWSNGPLSSLQRGLERALFEAPRLSGVLVLTVDRPHVNAATVTALLEAHSRSPYAFVQPVHSDTSGHPVVWPRAAIDHLLKLPATDSPRSLLSTKLAPKRARIPVDDPAVLDNIDRPMAYQALLQRDPEALSDL